jgi:hypothetical protein
VIPITGADVTAPPKSGAEWLIDGPRRPSNGISRGTPLEETAEFLCRDVGEVREKIAELKSRLNRAAVLVVPGLGADVAAIRSSVTSRRML